MTHIIQKVCIPDKKDEGPFFIVNKNSMDISKSQLEDWFNEKYKETTEQHVSVRAISMNWFFTND